jgi:hypothetical protein
LPWSGEEREEWVRQIVISPMQLILGKTPRFRVENRLPGGISVENDEEELMIPDNEPHFQFFHCFPV